MRIVLLASANPTDLYPESGETPSRWPQEAKDADVVIALYPPNAPRILKGPDGIDVIELTRCSEEIVGRTWRTRWFWRKRRGGRTLDEVESAEARERRNRRRRRLAARDKETA